MAVQLYTVDIAAKTATCTICATVESFKTKFTPFPRGLVGTVMNQKHAACLRSL